MNVKEGIAKLSKLFMQQQSLDEEVKEVKEAIKESGGNAAIAATVAKAIVANKVSDLSEKAETTEQYIELSRD